MNATVIGIINQKGGVGKSTTAGALCTGLTRRGYKALLLEFEPQGNDAFSFNVEASAEGLLDYLLAGKDLKDRIQHTEQGDIIGSDTSLSGIDVALDRKYHDSADKLLLLRDAVKPLRKLYDFIIVDTPPAMDLLSVNALCCCDEVIIPAKAEIYSLQGIGKLNETITAMKHYNKDLHVAGILLTMYEGNTQGHAKVFETLRSVADLLTTKVFAQPIRKCVGIADAQGDRQDIYTHKKTKHGNPVKDYDAFIDELLQDLKADK